MAGCYRQIPAAAAQGMLGLPEGAEGGEAMAALLADAAVRGLATASRCERARSTPAGGDQSWGVSRPASFFLTEPRPPPPPHRALEDFVPGHAAHTIVFKG
mmetsp:Transcript_9435/g.31005  ORF Transcript_9435/g.31005 Transcript_9435/m.31005 type:complete len:101 (-) Transcript_9435:136-438(-)